MDNQKAKTAEQWVGELDTLADRLQRISDSLGPIDMALIEGAVYRRVMRIVVLMFLVNNLIFIFLYFILR